MEGTGAAIRTPDQRLRVFISSTLKELAPERRAVRAVVERMGMAPVMFELGARPHPPRELYRAYLQQSDVFVGLYWEKYGWVAPGERVSGLEDEYNLAPPSMPKLIYIKEAAGEREPRLVELLDRIRSDDGASFKHFTDAGEFGDLLVAAVRGDVSSAGRLLGAAEATREHVGLVGESYLSPHRLLVDRMLAAGDDGTFDRERAAGRRMEASEAVSLALSLGAEPEAPPGAARPAPDAS